MITNLKVATNLPKNQSRKPMTQSRDVQGSEILRTNVRKDIGLVVAHRLPPHTETGKGTETITTEGTGGQDVAVMIAGKSTNFIIYLLGAVMKESVVVALRHL